MLPGFLASFFVDPEVAERNRERIDALVSGWNDETSASVLATLDAIGKDHTVYLANPHCRPLSRAWSLDAIVETSVYGVHHLADAAKDGPVVILCNHLSYYDATATDALLAWEGHEDLANRLLFAAGPKVYQHMFRKVAAACLNTVRVPQSQRLAHTDRLSARDMARHAISSMRATRRRMKQDRLILLLYPEGSRTRDGRLQPFLRGVHRYLGLVDHISVVPTTVLGTDHLMSVEDDERIVPSRVTLSFLEPIGVDMAGSAPEVLEGARARIAASLPEDHKPDPDQSPIA